MLKFAAAQCTSNSQHAILAKSSRFAKIRLDHKIVLVVLFAVVYLFARIRNRSTVLSSSDHRGSAHHEDQLIYKYIIFFLYNPSLFF